MERREMRLQRSPKEAAGGEDRHGGGEGKHVDRVQELTWTDLGEVHGGGRWIALEAELEGEDPATGLGETSE